MKKRLAIMLPLAAVVAAVMVYLLADRPWFVTNAPNTYDICADAPVSISFDQVDKTRGVYRIVNNGSSPPSALTALRSNIRKTATGIMSRQTIRGRVRLC